MSRRDTRTLEQREEAERMLWLQREQDRRDETITRGEVLEAIEQVTDELKRHAQTSADLFALKAFLLLARAIA